MSTAIEMYLQEIFEAAQREVGCLEKHLAKKPEGYIYKHVQDQFTVFKKGFDTGVRVIPGDLLLVLEQVIKVMPSGAEMDLLTDALQLMGETNEQEPVSPACKHCGGTGKDHSGITIFCPKCHGSGDANGS